MNIVKILFFIILALWCFVEIFKNFTHYKFYDWVVIIIFAVSPYIITKLISKRKKKEKNSIEKFQDITNQVGEASTQDISQPIENESPISYVETVNIIYRTGRKPILDEEVPYSIQTEYEQAVSSEKNSRNSTEYQSSNYMGMKIVPNTYPPKDGYDFLNENEKMFFQEFYQQLTAAKLSPYLIKLTRLSNGGFNVDYTTLCYVGKINLYQSPASYLVIKRVINGLQKNSIHCKKLRRIFHKKKNIA